jgi:hypothetical protein
MKKLRSMMNGFLAAMTLGIMLVTNSVSAQTFKPMGESNAPQAVVEGTFNGKMLKLPVYMCGTISAGAVVPCAVGSPGSGGGDASAANQASQIAAEQAIQAAVGTVTASPTQYTMLDRLKTINTTLGNPLQAGGAVTISNTPTVNIGTISTLSTAALQTSGNSSLTAIASSVAGATPAGSNIIGKVGIDQTTPGSTNGIVVNSSALPTGAATQATLATVATNTLTGVFYNGATGTGSLLGASATYTGAARDVGVATSTGHPYAYFNAYYLTDQVGTARIDCSNDNTTWYTCATSALVAATPLIMTVPVMTRYHRAVVVNGATAETYLWVNSSYTGA